MDSQPSPSRFLDYSLAHIAHSLRTLPEEMWLDLLRQDQTERWLRGEGVPAEHYFEILPELRNEKENALIVIYSEYSLRRDLGETVTPEDYLTRFPDLADDLTLQFALEAAIFGNTVPPSPCFEPPTHIVLPGFEILKAIGQGSSGKVYLARQLSVDRHVAIKVIPLATADARHLKRYRQEPAILSKLHHPNVVQIFDVMERGEFLYLIIEYIDGPTLAELTSGKPMVAEEAARLARTLALALDLVHEAGILHRDLKPSNILLTRAGDPKITDFGLAKQLTSDLGASTQDCILGTPSFMPPEQISGLGMISSREGDIYSLGAILYEMLTGFPPFLGVTILDTLTMIRERDPVPPGTLQPRTPRDLETICLKCLHKTPSHRYKTMRELAADLDRFLTGQPVSARRPPWHEKTWRWCRRNRVVAVLIAALLLVLVTGFSGVVWQWKTAERARANEAVARLEADHRAEEIREGMDHLQSALVLMDRGRYFISTRRWDDAVDAFSEAIRLRPTFAPAWEERGRLYLELGLWELAKVDRDRMVELKQPGTNTDWWSHSVLLAYVQDTDRYQAFCRRMEDHFLGHRGLGAMDVVRASCLIESPQVDYRQKLELAKAGAVFSQKDPLTLYVVGLASLRSGELQQAAQFAAEGVLFTQAESAYGPLCQLVLAMAQKKLGNQASAEQALDVAAAGRDLWTRSLFENSDLGWVMHKGATARWSVTPWEWMEFQLLFREAWTLVRGGMAPEDYRWTILRARALAALGRYSGALPEYEAALEVVENDVELHVEYHRSMAYLCIGKEDFMGSAAAFQSAADLKPQDATLRTYEALAELAGGDVAAYRQTCQAMCASFRSTTDPWAAHNIVYACVCAPDTLPDYMVLSQFVALGERAFPGAGRVRAGYCVRTGDYEGAVEHFRSSARLHPHRAWDWAMLAMAEYHLGNEEESRKCLDNSAAWIAAADAHKLPEIDVKTPSWGNWSWNERPDSLRLLAEARRLINANGHSSGIVPGLK